MDKLSDQLNNQIQNAIIFTIVSLLTSQITNIFNFTSTLIKTIINYIGTYFIEFNKNNHYEIKFNLELTKIDSNTVDTGLGSGSDDYYMISSIINFYLIHNKIISKQNLKTIENANFKNNNVFNSTDFNILYDGNIINIKYYTNVNINEQKVTITKKSITFLSKISINHIKSFIFEFNEKLKNSNKTNPVYYYLCNPIDKYMEIFPLTLYKTFDDLYIPEKPQVELLLNKFQNKEFRNLGLLLYGEGGTGKTSLIKIIANKTKRHIINIKLSNIKNLKELMSIFFNINIKISENTHTSIPFNKRLYIFEDIDAETDIVFKRSETPSETSSETDFSFLKNTNIDEDKIDKFISSWNFNKLKLADLLNIFDGILELHDTIYIITTNHPDKLDPALIRPGRINMRLELKKMIKSEMMKMFSYRYRNKETNKNLKNFEHLFDFIKDYTWTPAQIEEFIYESDTINILADRLLEEKKMNFK